MAASVESDIVYYSPAARPAGNERPDFLRLPLAPVRMRIDDIRGCAAPSLDREGFTLLKWPTKVTNVCDAPTVQKVYGAEVDELLRSLTGCKSTCSAGPGGLRTSAPVEKRPKFYTGPVNFAHADFNFRDAVRYHLRRILAPAEADRRLQQRFALFNIWRPVTEPPQDVPLALCDAQTVRAQDRQSCSIRLPGTPLTWEAIAYFHNPNHRWLYCSEMMRDEVYVFRCFDSELEPVPHCAFVHPACPAGVPPRESIEIRFFAFFEE
jgi:hypothetical protein